MTRDERLGDVYDFTLRVVRDRDLAADVVRNAFALGDVDIYLEARRRALEALKHRRRLANAAQRYREGLDFTRVDAERLREPSAVLFDKELVELVWESAAALPPEEYALLDLNVRRGLGAEELGETDLRLTRLRDSFEETVAATLLATRGRRTCERLQAVLEELEIERVTPEGLRAVRQHVRGCKQCKETVARFVSPLEIFASFALMPPPAAARLRVEEGG